MKMLAKIGLSLVVAAVLAACAAGPGKMKPPAVSLAELKIEESGALTLRLRIRNLGERDLEASDIDLVMSEGEVELASSKQSVDFKIPPLGVETLAVELTDAQNLVERLQALSSRERPELGYLLKGSVGTEPDGKRFDFRNRSRLTRTPGRPNSFR